MMDTTKVYSDNFLDKKRGEGDQPADLFINSIFGDADQKKKLQFFLSNLKSNSQLHKLPATFVKHEIINSANRLPDWADSGLMKQGAVFFARHASVIMNLLGLLSLPYCYTAANGAMVLYLSDRMKIDTEKRLFETADFIWDVMAPDAFEQSGKGIASILKVRLIHAAARFYTLKSGKWNEESGIPINQEDMAGTNLSFSIIVIRGLRKFGFSIDYNEQLAFIHLWNVIGYLLGVKESLLPFNGKQAFELEKIIRKRQFKPSVHGQELTGSLIKYFSTADSSPALSSREVAEIMRYLLGDDIANMLGISLSNLPFYKIRLLRTINFLNKITEVKNPQAIYNNEYYKFKRAKPLLS